MRHMSGTVWGVFEQPVRMHRGHTMAGCIKDERYHRPDREFVGGYFMQTVQLGFTRAGGRIVQVGIQPAGQSAVLVNKLVAKELELIGTFLSNEEFRWAVDAWVHGRIDIGPHPDRRVFACQCNQRV